MEKSKVSKVVSKVNNLCYHKAEGVNNSGNETDMKEGLENILMWAALKIFLKTEENDLKEKVGRERREESKVNGLLQV